MFFEGLVESTRLFSKEPAQRFLIVMGDAGSRQQEISPIINSITSIDKPAITIYSYQVNSPQHQSYQDFIDQNKQIIEQTVNSYIVKGKRKTLDGGEPNSEWSETKNNDRIYSVYNSGGALPRFSFTFPVRGNSISASDLESDMFVQFDRDVRLVSEKLEEEVIQPITQGVKVNYGTITIEDEKTGNENYKIASGGEELWGRLQNLVKSEDLSEEQLSILLESNPVFAIKTYSPRKIKGSEHNLLSEVLLISGNEKDYLTNVFQILLESTDGNRTKEEAFEKAVVSWCKNHWGGNTISKFNDIPADLTWNKFFRESFGFELNNDFGDLPVKSKPKIDGDCETELCKYFDRVYDRLSDDAEMEYLKFVSAGITYYWVPVDYFN
jgi:hypothetical protein